MEQGILLIDGLAFGTICIIIHSNLIKLYQMPNHPLEVSHVAWKISSYGYSDRARRAEDVYIWNFWARPFEFHFFRYWYASHKWSRTSGLCLEFWENFKISTSYFQISQKMSSFFCELNLQGRGQGQIIPYSLFIGNWTHFNFIDDCFGGTTACVLTDGVSSGKSVCFWNHFSLFRFKQIFMFSSYF